MHDIKVSSGPEYLSSWVLAPFWTARLGLILFHTGYLIWLISLLVRYTDDALGLYIVYEVRDGGFTRTILSAIAVAALITCVIFELICILKQVRGTLSPRFLLFATGLQSALWTAIFVPSMLTYHDTLLFGTGIALTVVLWVLFLYAGFALYKQKGIPSYSKFQDDEETSFKQYPSVTTYESSRSVADISLPDPSATRYEPIRERQV